MASVWATSAAARFLWRRPTGVTERYEDSYRLCHRRGPEGIIVELAEQIG